MSRTYRAAKLPIDCSCDVVYGWARRGDQPTQEQTDRETNKARRKGVVPEKCCGCRWDNRKYDCYSKRNHKRDNKPKENCSETYKKAFSRIRRAKVKQAMRNGNYEKIPIFRKNNNDNRRMDWY